MSDRLPTLPAGTRVRVRPGSGAAELVEGLGETGTVKGTRVYQTDGKEHVTVQMDSGRHVFGTLASDWELVAHD